MFYISIVTLRIASFAAHLNNHAAFMLSFARSELKIVNKQLKKVDFLYRNSAFFENTTAECIVQVNKQLNFVTKTILIVGK